MTALADRHCRALPAGTPALGAAQAQVLLAELPTGWALPDGVLCKTWRFPDFASALAFVNRVGALADAQDHHPDVLLAWGRVELRIWTHSVGGLSDNDFILAARVERL